MAGYDTTLDIQVLRGLEHVRKRPGMYVGEVDGEGRYELLCGVVDAVIELDQSASHVGVTIDADSWVTVTDDGPGLPIEMIGDKRAIEMLFTEVTHRSERTPFGVEAYGIASGLSETLVVKTTRDGELWTQTFARGTSTDDLTSLGPSDQRGTSIRFRIDSAVFPGVEFDHALIGERLRARAAWNPSLAIDWQGLRLPSSSGGLAGWARSMIGDLVEAECAAHLDIQAQPGASVNVTGVEIAVAWGGDGPPIVRAFMGPTVVPLGSHVDALWTGLASLAARLVDTSITTNAVTARLGPGLVAIVQVHYAHPYFRRWLGGTMKYPEPGAAVESALAGIDADDALRRFLLARLL